MLSFSPSEYDLLGKLLMSINLPWTIFFIQVYTSPILSLFYSYSIQILPCSVLILSVQISSLSKAPSIICWCILVLKTKHPSISSPMSADMDACSSFYYLLFGSNILPISSRIGIILPFFIIYLGSLPNSSYFDMGLKSFLAIPSIDAIAFSPPSF